MSNLLVDTKIISNIKLENPNSICNFFPLSEKSEKFIKKIRQEITDIIYGKDKRIIVILGPCSIHDLNSAEEYADFVLEMREKFNDKLLIIMRTYFVKPRTTVGWKGYLYDPYLDNSNRIDIGLRKIREFLCKITELEVPCSMEHLDNITPQYFDDLLCWSCIGARTVESQIHRELASGISTPVGFKNPISGDINIAIQAIKSAMNSHSFLGCNKDGNISNVITSGNPDTHLVLRGSKYGPNYYKDSLQFCSELLESNNIKTQIIIDCSHGNSEKDYKKQIDVINYISKLNKSEKKSICGFMIESNLVEGKQDIKDIPLIYGKSITDSCVNLEETEKMLNILYNLII